MSHDITDKECVHPAEIVQQVVVSLNDERLAVEVVGLLFDVKEDGVGFLFVGGPLGGLFGKLVGDNGVDYVLEEAAR